MWTCTHYVKCVRQVLPKTLVCFEQTLLLLSISIFKPQSMESISNRFINDDTSFKCMPLHIRSFSLMNVYNGPQWLSEWMYMYINIFCSWKTGVNQSQCMTKCYKTVQRHTHWQTKNHIKMKCACRHTIFCYNKCLQIYKINYFKLSFLDISKAVKFINSLPLPA